ncbi:MAG: outer membrane beta-barrel protein, partial [Chitinophagaceae bacterium]
ADLTFGKSGLMLGVANPTDFKTAPMDSKKYFLAQYSIAATDNIKLYLNYVAGKRFTDTARTSQIDLVATVKLTDKFNIGYNGTINSTVFQESPEVYASTSKKWWGSALYLNVDPTEKLGLTLRSEYFSDKHQLVAMSLAPEGANIFANTISLNLKSGPLTIIPELRFESANKPVYFNAEGNTVSSTANFLLAAIYKF